MTTSLLSAVFRAPACQVPKAQWDSHLPALRIAYSELPALQQSLLQHYYDNACSQSELAKTFSISVHKCGRELRLALHALRKAANPLYRQAYLQASAR